MAMYPQAAAQSAYGQPQAIYSPQTVTGGPYAYPSYQKQQIVYADPQPQTIYVAQTQPSQGGDTTFTLYQEVPHPSTIYQRAMPTAPSIAQLAVRAKKEKPSAYPHPPAAQIPRREVQTPAAKNAVDDIGFSIPPRQPSVTAGPPPGEFDIICRGALPSIVFHSEVAPLGK
jgi:hypothetical protein